MLTSSNYFAWSKAIRYTLEAGNAWDIVMEQELPPAAPPANANAHTRELYKNELTNYKARYSYAAITIYQSCTPAIQGYINNNPTPAEMWRILHERVDLMTDPRAAMDLRFKLNSVRFDGQGDVKTFIAAVIEYRDQLANTSEAVTEQDVVRHIVQNLPNSWYLPRDMILDKPPAERTLQYVERTLLRHQDNIQALAKDEIEKAVTPASNALLANTDKNSEPSTRGRGQGRGSGRGRGRGGYRGGYRGTSSHMNKGKGKEQPQDQEGENRC